MEKMELLRRKDGTVNEDKCPKCKGKLEIMGSWGLVRRYNCLN